MPIVEYPAGVAVPGRDRPHGRRVEPGLAGARRARRRAPRTCCSSCSTTPASGSSAATAARSRRRTSTRSPPTGCASATCTRRRCARRAASCIITGRNHHSNGMACITELATGYPGYNGIIPFENGLLSEMLRRARLQHVHGRQVAPDAERPGDGRRARTTAGRSAAASSASTASSAATRASGTPSSCTTTTRSSRRGRPRRATTSPRTWSTSRSSSSPTSGRSTPTSRSTCTSCFGATHAPHHVPKEWADRYAGQFDDGWDAYREKVFARQKELGIVPADAELSRHDPDVPEWESLSPDARRLSARMMEVFAGFLEPHRPPPRPAARLPARAGRARQHDRHGHLRQRRERRGRPDRARPTRPSSSTTPRRRSRRASRVIDELGGPEHFNHYPWGWTWAGNTPFRRWKRETYRGGSTDPFIVSWPAGIKAPGRGPHPVRPHHRHGADGARPARHRAAGDDPRRDPVADPGRELRRRARRPGRPQPPPHPVLRDARPPGDLQRRLAGGVPVARPVVRRGRHRLRQPDLGREAHRARRHRLGAVPRRRGPGREPQPGGRPPRQADRADRDLVRRGRQVRRHAGRRQRPAADGRREAARRRRRATGTRTAPGTQSIPNFAAPRLLNRPHSITASVEIPEGGAEGVLFCQGTAAGGYSLYVKDGRLHYVHNYVARQLFTVSSPDPLPAGRHELRFEFEPTGQPDMAHGKGAPGTAPALRRRRAWSRAPTRRTPRRSCSTRAASAAATTRGRR